MDLPVVVYILFIEFFLVIDIINFTTNRFLILLLVIVNQNYTIQLSFSFFVEYCPFSYYLVNSLFFLRKFR